MSERTISELKKILQKHENQKKFHDLTSKSLNHSKTGISTPKNSRSKKNLNISISSVFDINHRFTVVLKRIRRLILVATPIMYPGNTFSSDRLCFFKIKIYF